MRYFGTFLVIALLSFGAYADDPVDLTILHMNDIHSHLLPYPYAEGEARYGGIARAAALINEMRDNGDNVLLLNAGDLWAGDLMFGATYDPVDAPIVGYADFFVTNLMGFDAFALGNHEFDLGPDMLYAVLSNENIQENLPPILGANFVNLEDHPGLASIVRPDTIIERGGLSIGIIGFLTEETNTIAIPAPLVVDALWEGDLMDPASLQPKDTYQTMIDDMRNRGADIVIALTHVGHAGEIALGQLYDGIDIIVGGHSHSTYYDTITGPQGNTIPYVRAGAYTENLGELTVTIENNEVTNHTHTLHNVFDAPEEDLVVAGAVDNFKQMAEQRWPGAYSDVVADIPFYMDGLGETDGYVDKAETNLGNLITDATRAKLGTDVAIEAAGVIRQSILEGNVTPADIYRVLGWGFRPDRGEVGARLVIADVPGLALAGALEHSVSHRGTSNFFQVSGITFEYDSSIPPDQDRVDFGSIRINGEALQIGARYTVGINEIVAESGLQLGFIGEGDTTQTPYVQFDVLREYIDTVDISLYEDVEGRIVDTADPVSVPINDEIPSSIELKQNYPNPFNPSTTIRYHLDTRSSVNLEVYNVLGQKVTTLVNDDLPAGIHQVEFDTGNVGGTNLSSGVYLYRLTISNDDAGTVSKVRRMVLMK